MGKELILAVAAVACLVFLVFLLIFFSVLRLWIQALLTGTPVSMAEIIRMRLLKCPPRVIVHAMIALWQRGVRVPVREVEAAYLALGRSVTASELADVVEEAKRNASAPPQT